jgi:hypothetical protein
LQKAVIRCETSNAPPEPYMCVSYVCFGVCVCVYVCFGVYTRVYIDLVCVYVCMLAKSCHTL